MGLKISDFLAITASLVSIAAGTARLIQYFREAQKRNPAVIWGTISTVTIVVIIAIVFSNVYSSTNPNQATISLKVASNLSTTSSVSYVSPTHSAMRKSG